MVDAGAEGSSGDVAPETLSEVEAERDALLAQRDELEARLEKIQRPRRRRFRRTVVAVLVALTSLLVVLSTVVVWAHHTVLNTDTFVGTVAPVLEVPGVDAAIATRATEQLFTALDVQQRLRQELPPRIAFAAVPITSATESAVAGQLTKVIGSQRFEQLWTDILTQTHEQVVAILRGHHTTTLSTTNGYIVLNTVPLVNRALGQVSGLVSSLTGHQVRLPTITSAQLPQQAVDRLSRALGVRLPSDFGQITLVRSKNLSVAQRGVRAFDRLTILLPIVTAALIALTLWLSVARRRTLIQLVTVTALLTIVVRRVVIYEHDDLSKAANNPGVAHAVLGQLLAGFYDGTLLVVWGAVLILAVALLTGPYRWSVALRSWVRRGWEQAAHVLDAEHRERAVRWIGPHASVLQVAAAVVAFVLFLIVSFSWISLIVIGGLLAACEIYLNAVKVHPSDPDVSDIGPGPPPSAPDPSEAAASRA